MKYLYVFLFTILITGCNRAKYVEFTGSIPGISDGMFVIKDKDGTQLYAENIFAGKFQTRKILQKPGYYDMFIIPDINKDETKKLYNVYLEEGAYSISSEGDKLYKYPVIKSASKIQNELSDYYTLASEKIHEAKQKVEVLTEMLYGRNSDIVVHSGEFDRLLGELSKANDKLDNVQAVALEEYVNKHPQNDVEAHILSEIDYKKDPADYYRIFQKFTNAEKNSPEGKTENDDLSELAKLAPGAPAPKLSGKTLDGKPFDAKTITEKKVILVEFWRSDSQVSRENHHKILEEYSEFLSKKNFAIISISLDPKQDVWLAAVKEDRLTWPQINDLRGESSPNMMKWSVNAIPTYDLLDGSWHFIKRDMPFKEIALTIEDQLKK